MHSRLPLAALPFVVLALNIVAIGLLPAAARGYQEGQVNDGATIRGRASYSGNIPMKKIIPSNPEVCGPPHDIPLIETSDDKGVTDAVVYLEKVDQGKAWPKQTETPQLDNRDCRFVPQLVAMPPGPLIILNSDPILHNTHAFYGRRTALNIALPKAGLEIKRQLNRPGILRVECDEHGHMSARVFVAANPYYATTSNAGKFSIDQIPPGEYKLIVYQEQTGPVESVITLKGGETQELDIDLMEKKISRR